MEYTGKGLAIMAEQFSALSDKTAEIAYHAERLANSLNQHSMTVILSDEEAELYAAVIKYRKHIKTAKETNE